LPLRACASRSACSRTRLPCKRVFALAPLAG
jgi:hypothetical protein